MILGSWNPKLLMELGDLPSGKHTKNYGTSQVSWVNPI
jgi:hypothetical protein